MVFEIGKIISGYEIVEILDSSKIGVAYKVRNVLAQRFEVLKLLPKNVKDDEQQVARFLCEIKVHARLVLPNVVTFYNAREIEGQVVMTTEFLPGITVAERLENGPILWRDAIRYTSHALSALEYAHARGIVHRGLTSTNLVITTEGIVRLGGFGLAKAVTGSAWFRFNRIRGRRLDGRRPSGLAGSHQAVSGRPARLSIADAR